MDNKKRCAWCNPKNPLYIAYHDSEWCVPNFDEQYLYEMLLLESFQAGLSWECVLNKRESFRKAYDHFDIDKVISYDENKIEELLSFGEPNPDRFSHPAFRQCRTKLLDNINGYCLRRFVCLAKKPGVKTAKHPSARNFLGLLGADDAALLAQGKKDNAKRTKKNG